MKNFATILPATAFLVSAAVVLAACDRSMDNIDPPEIQDNAYGPGFSYPSIMRNTGGPPTPEEAEDAYTGGKDVVTRGDVAETDIEGDAFECTGSATFCACLAGKSNDPKYTEYCECMDAPSVPGGDHLTYCGCCVFAYDPSFPEYDTEWKFLAVGTCDPPGYQPPCQFD